MNTKSTDRPELRPEQAESMEEIAAMAEALKARHDLPLAERFYRWEFILKELDRRASSESTELTQWRHWP